MSKTCCGSIISQRLPELGNTDSRIIHSDSDDDYLDYKNRDTSQEDAYSKFRFRKWPGPYLPFESELDTDDDDYSYDETVTEGDDEDEDGEGEAEEEAEAAAEEVTQENPEEGTEQTAAPQTEPAIDAEAGSEEIAANPELRSQAEGVQQTRKRKSDDEAEDGDDEAEDDQDASERIGPDARRRRLH